MPPDITAEEARAAIRVPRFRTSSTIPPSSRSCVSSTTGLSGPPGTSDAWGVGVAVGGPVRANVTVSDPAGLGVRVGVAS